MNRPWESTSDVIEVLHVYPSQVINTDSKYGVYGIEIVTKDDVAYGAVLKEDFDSFSHPVGKGTYFNLVSYKIVGKEGVLAGPWPIAEYWNESIKDALAKRREQDEN